MALFLYAWFQNSAISTAVIQYDSSLCVKYGLTFNMFMGVLMGLGTDKHFEYADKAKKGEVCYVGS